MTTLKIFNTSTRKKEIFKPLKEDEVTLYTCGPTVYNFAHIGNFRTYVFEDLLRRSLKFLGYRVTQAMNLTDVDDKTIKGAIANNCSLDAYTEPYKKAFFEDLTTLKIERVEHYPAATDYIPQMIRMIEILIEKGFAYKGSDQSIYYSISRFPHYGCLSHLRLDELQVGASERLAADEYDKESAADFVLWKHYDKERDGAIYWESPFGKGRPGWHLECSAMATYLLGKTIDIHVGGVDNMFPHHENEIAQSEACYDTKFSNYWMHVEHLVVNQQKMSKSLGNFFTLRDLTSKGYTGRQVRYLLLQTHYKTQLNFTFQGLDAAKHALERIDDFFFRLKSLDEGAPLKEETIQLGKDLSHSFSAALCDDFNISGALATLFDFIRETNALCDLNKLSKDDGHHLLEVFKTIDSALGIFEFSEENEEEIPHFLNEALEKRNQARAEKNWQQADEMRKLISEHGYRIEDTPKGTRLKKV